MENVATNKNAYFEFSIHLLHLWPFAVMSACILVHGMITRHGGNVKVSAITKCMKKYEIRTSS
jgi:hypothetical protein